MTITAKRLHVELRWMVLANLPRVLEVEQLCCEFPWGQEDFRRVLAHRSCIGMVAWIPSVTGNFMDEQLAGYMVYHLARTRVELLNMAVLPSVQRRGVATTMIAKLKSKLSAQRRTRITAEVRDSNLDAQLFLRAMQFKATKVIPSCYEHADEDAYLFVHRLPKAQVKS